MYASTVRALTTQMVAPHNLQLLVKDRVLELRVELTSQRMSAFRLNYKLITQVK